MSFCKVFVVLLAILVASDGNKYSEEKNKEDKDPFRMMKINLIWNKAKMRLPKEDLVQLYRDLKVQDQFETDLKKKKAAGHDEDGEFEALVIRKSLDLMSKYGLESIHPDSPPDINNHAHEQQDSKRWEKVMSDKKLNKLWKKAQLSGFTAQELGALKAEFLHHVDKLDELNLLHSDLNEIIKEDPQGNSMADFQNKQNKRESQVNLKNKHRELRDSFSRLEGQLTTNKDGLSEKVAGGFSHPKVIELWFAARNSNFTEEELNSIKEELHHFEHKVKKLEHLQDEHDTIGSKMDQKNLQLTEYPEKQYKIMEKVKDYKHKVKKYETDLRDRISQASRHNEL